MCGPNLSNLLISETDITGEGFNEMDRTLESLQLLVLDCCFALTDVGLMCILRKCGRNLKTLYLRGTLFPGFNFDSGPAPSIGVDSLNLNYNQRLQDKGLTCLLKTCAPTLRILSLGLTRISGELEKSFFLPNLEVLNLPLCKGLTERGLSHIISMCGNGLRTIDLRNTTITGANLIYLAGSFSGIATLQISNCKHLTDSGLVQFLRLCGANLRRLDLGGTNISGEEVSHFSGFLDNLESLNLFNCKLLSDQGLGQLLRISGRRLELLNVGGTNITGENVSRLTRPLPELSKLYLDRCRNITEQGLCDLIQVCGDKIRLIDLEKTDISGEGLNEITRKFFEMDILNLNSCRNLTDCGLKEILRIFGFNLSVLSLGETGILGDGLDSSNILDRVEHLILFGCKELTDTGLCIILKICGPSLKELDLSRTLVSGSGPDKICTLSNLQVLNLLHCLDLTDQGFQEFISSVKRTLKTLIIGRTNISGRILLQVVTELQILERLDPFNCPNITGKDLRRLKSERSNLKIFRFKQSNSLNQNQT